MAQRQEVFGVSIVIDGIYYPDSWQRLRVDGPLLRVFKAYAKEAGIEANVIFLGYPFDPARHYGYFIPADGWAPIRISPATRQRMVDLWTAGDLTNPAWNTHIAAAKAEIERELDADHIGDRTGRFWQSAIFKAHHECRRLKYGLREETGAMGMPNTPTCVRRWAA